MRYRAPISLPVEVETETELRALLSSGALRGMALHVLVLHDRDRYCTPSRCQCSPSYRVEAFTAESYAAGQRAEAEMLKRSAS